MSKSTLFFAALFLATSGVAVAANTIVTDLPDFYSQDHAIQGVLFNATLGNTNLHWSISAGTIPPGLTLLDRWPLGRDANHGRNLQLHGDVFFV